MSHFDRSTGAKETVLPNWPSVQKKWDFPLLALRGIPGGEEDEVGVMLASEQHPDFPKELFETQEGEVFQVPSLVCGDEF